MSATKRNVHVVPDKSHGQLDWSVKRDHAKRSSGHFENKVDALREARRIAINNRLEMFEHGKDGRIQNRNTYTGQDPFPPRG